MSAGAVGLLVLLSVESYKASARFFHRRRSRKHGYSSLRTDSLGRPISEDGKLLSKNEAKALVEHHKEIERIRTAEREWRAKGERLPAYEEMDNEAIIQSLRRPSTAPASGRRSSSSVPSSSRTSSDNSVPTANTGRRVRAISTASAPLELRGVREQRDARNDDLAASITQPGLDGGAFSIRRRTQTLVLPTIPSTNESPEIEDIFQHDGLDWRRATWESPPIYEEEREIRVPAASAVAAA